MNLPQIDDDPNVSDFLPLVERLNKEIGIGSILMSCSFIENLLGEIILAYLVDSKESKDLLQGATAPLATFSSRINMTYALGLITRKERAEIEILRKIRNDCAHNFRTSLDSQKIKDLCKNLAFDIGDENISVEGHIKLASVALIMLLIKRPQYLKENRLLPISWMFSHT